LNENNVRTKPPAFVEGHSTVVRSIYAQGICDFGATVIDARQSPAVLQDLPDVNRRVQVIWRIEPLIPYEVVVVASGMPDEVRFTLTQTLAQLTQTAEGQTAMQNLYRVEALQPVNDDFYALFMHYVEASGLDLSSLVK
jgi:phosphonate transport system substrate-binding protein